MPFDEKGKTEIGKAAVCSVGIMFGAAFLTEASFEATAMVKGMGFKGAMSTPVAQEAAKGLIEGLTVATGPPSNSICARVNIGKDIIGFFVGE